MWNPGEYKKQGTGLQITYGFHDTPFGHCLLATTERGICALYFVHQGERPAGPAQLAAQWPQANLIEDPGQTRPLVDRIFAPGSTGQARPFHLLLKGTNFQVKVWQALLSIPPGSMVSYGDLAAYLGQPGATRAVASAIARNPVAYLIPCHRVIARSGRIHHYQWGATRKKALLGWEASQQRQTSP